MLAELLTELRRQTALLESAQGNRDGESKALLSKREAARLLGISRGRTLDGLIASGRIHAVRIGGRLKIPSTEISRLRAAGQSARAPVATRAERRGQIALNMNDSLKKQGF